jgi:hypothetical protein
VCFSDDVLLMLEGASGLIGTPGPSSAGGLSLPLGYLYLLSDGESLRAASFFGFTGGVGCFKSGCPWEVLGGARRGEDGEA